MYENNPSLQAARAELQKTEELYPQARAGWRPSLNADASIFSTNVESSNFGSGDGATTKDYTLSVNQPIFRGGRTFAETARAKELIKAGQAILKQAEQDIFLETAVAYMNVMRDREILELRTKNELVLQEESRAAQERFDMGDITRTDVRQAQVRLARAQANKIESSSNLDASEAKFEEIVGYAPPRNLVAPYGWFSFPESQEELTALAVQKNPDIWIATHQHNAAEDNIDVNIRELFPQISAFASHNKQYDPQPGIIDKSETQMVGVRASLALYQGGATRSRIREARSAEKKRLAEIEETQRRIRQETTSNWKFWLAARAEMQARNVEVRVAEQALNGVREESRLGQRTVLDILDADQEVFDAKAALAGASRNEIVAGYALAASLGMLMPEKIGMTPPGQEH